MNAEYPASWNEESKAGMKWYRLFMKRHQTLSLRTPEQTSLNRIKSFCASNVNAFFAQLNEVTTTTHFSAENIWNMDETGFSTVPTKVGKVISLKGEKKVGQISSAERGSMVTMALAVNAAGSSIAPFFLFPRKNMQTTFMDNASEGAVGYANESGWMQQSDFVKYMRHFIAKSHSSKMAPVLLLLDNHTSHLSVEALDIAAENGVTLLSFPPHCSHRMQPLDVSVYGPVKAYYKNECAKWHKNNAGKVLEIRHIVGLVNGTLDLALTRSNIKAGFAATGIFPYNNTVFTEKDFVAAEFDLEREAAVAIENNVDENQQRRIVVLDTVPTVAAYETVSSSDTSSVSSSLSSLVAAIGPLKATTPKPPSNRGRKPMKSAVLTSPEFLSELKEKRQNRDEAQKKKEGKASKPAAQTSKRAATTVAAKTPAKRCKKTQSTLNSSEEDIDFCIICLDALPRILTSNNSIKCNTCQLAVHLKCANIQTSYFTCKSCDSDYE